VAIIERAGQARPSEVLRRGEIASRAARIASKCSRCGKGGKLVGMVHEGRGYAFCDDCAHFMAHGPGTRTISPLQRKLAAAGNQPALRAIGPMTLARKLAEYRRRTGKA
jgi:hypothetical protein